MILFELTYAYTRTCSHTCTHSLHTQTNTHVHTHSSHACMAHITLTPHALMHIHSDYITDMHTMSCIIYTIHTHSQACRHTYWLPRSQAYVPSFISAMGQIVQERFLSACSSSVKRRLQLLSGIATFVYVLLIINLELFTLARAMAHGIASLVPRPPQTFILQAIKAWGGLGTRLGIARITLHNIA